jgi:hypothetical protein
MHVCSNVALAPHTFASIPEFIFCLSLRGRLRCINDGQLSRDGSGDGGTSQESGDATPYVAGDFWTTLAPWGENAWMLGCPSLMHLRLPRRGKVYSARGGATPSQRGWKTSASLSRSQNQHFNVGAGNGYRLDDMSFLFFFMCLEPSVERYKGL